jgi:hypothetical protein
MAELVKLQELSLDDLVVRARRSMMSKSSAASVYYGGETVSSLILFISFTLTTILFLAFLEG